MSTTDCRRCGTCCEKGGPALHMGDVDLLEHIPLCDLVCLRVGEMAHDPRSSRMRALEMELIKIRGKGRTWECLYLHQASCTIYSHRPAECGALSCHDTREILQVMSIPTISRADMISTDSGLWACIAEHEHEFPVAKAMALATAAEYPTSTISKELDSMVRREICFRKAFADTVQAKDEELWVYFGRPLWLILAPLNPTFLRYECV